MILFHQKFRILSTFNAGRFDSLLFPIFPDFPEMIKFPALPYFFPISWLKSHENPIFPPKPPFFHYKPHQKPSFPHTSPLSTKNPCFSWKALLHLPYSYLPLYITPRSFSVSLPRKDLSRKQLIFQYILTVRSFLFTVYYIYTTYALYEIYV